MPDSTARRLIRIPIVHNPSDLGSLSEPVRELYRRRFGQGAWRKRVESVGALWETIRGQLEGLELDYPRVRLYQDALPRCGREAEIVRELAEAGSENHRLIAALMEKGARLMGTESPELLVHEYRLARNTMGALQDAADPQAARRQEERSRELLERRDRYIAQRIADTLRPGETGLLFVGLLHAVGEYLPEDLEVRDLLDSGEAS